MENTNSKRKKSIVVNFCGIFGSRIFGLVRDVAMTSYWGGSGAAQAAFHLAFMIPNTFRQLFGEGALTAAFVPQLAGKLETSTKDDAWRFAERIITLQAIVLAAIVVLISVISLGIYVCIPDTVREHIRLTFKILPLLMPYSLLICATGCFGAILNALRKFALPSFNPILFNVVQIAAVIILSRLWPNDDPKALYCFCGSIILAGVLQVASLMYGCYRQGFVFHFKLDCKNEDVRTVCNRFAPAVVGSGANILNQFIDQIMVGFLGPLAVSSINYSHRLIYLPVGLFGVAIGLVCLTDMSRAASKHDNAELSECLTFSLRTVLFLSVPCTILFYVFAEPFVRLLFFRGAFNEDAVNACVFALKYYLPGIPAFCMMKIATTPHHANGDTRTPVRIALACIALNLILNLTLIQFLQQGGLALATTICSWLNVIMLLILVRKHIPGWSALPAIFTGILWLVFSCIAGFAAYKICNVVNLSQYIEPGLKLYLAQVALGAASGAIIYLALSSLILLYFLKKHRKSVRN